MTEGTFCRVEVDIISIELQQTIDELSKIVFTIPGSPTYVVGLKILLLQGMSETKNRVGLRYKLRKIWNTCYKNEFAFYIIKKNTCTCIQKNKIIGACALIRTNIVLNHSFISLFYVRNTVT